MSNGERDEDKKISHNKAINPLINQWDYKINNNLLFTILEENENYHNWFSYLNINIR